MRKSISRRRRSPSSSTGLGRNAGSGGLPKGRDQRCDLLQPPQEVRRVDVLGDEAAAPARGGECPTDADRGRPLARQGDAAGRHQAKALRPARKRSISRSCARVLAGEHPSCLPRSASRALITTAPDGPGRPASSNGSRRSPRRACVTAIAEFMCCSSGRAGMSTLRGRSPSSGRRPPCARDHRPEEHRTISATAG